MLHNSKFVYHGYMIFMLIRRPPAHVLLRYLAVQAERRPVGSVSSSEPAPTMVPTTSASTIRMLKDVIPAQERQQNSFMNGLLAIVRNEVENNLSDSKQDIDSEEATNSSPTSAMRLMPETSDELTNSVKHESLGDDESGIDMSAILGVPLSASPSSSGAGSSISDDGNLLNVERAKFELPVPHPAPRELNIQFVCETASRLLFLSVHWMKKIRNISSKLAAALLIFCFQLYLLTGELRV
ncbi:hypothetical protein AB6A40_009979 [Gnathostoma spinigerum]|uniref:Uncharacterized protein n=1 Tax=Gnathostoma spinigerum TaxID=75299 RepID=A0ABD6ETH0_9BILA